MFSKRLLVAYIFLLVSAICLTVVLIYFKPMRFPVRDYPQIHEEGVLRIVTEYDYTGYYVSGDRIEGFQYALSREIARLSGMEVLMYLEMSLGKSFYGLSAGQYDIVARNIPVTSELKERYLFLDPVMLNRQVLVQRTAAANFGIEPLRNQLNLAHKTLRVPAESPALLRLANLQREIGDTIFVIEDPLYSSEQLCIMVAGGDIDFAVCDLQVAQRLKKLFPALDIDTDISFTQLQSWAVRRNATVLADSLNCWLKRIRDSGVYDRIYREYY
ncbi:MAG: transporter substrate-binding domain-containing protein [Tannerella sp.]|jgi:membrane-bound lytic murein transglycosylase MltF|nr:transporter substrate-binding domain-containing protein [Tannerella sp.]